MQSPHDHLFHYTFGQPENAADLLRSTLPAALVRAIDWRTLARCDAKLTDGETESRFADLLFTVMVRGVRTYLFILLEHKSESDPDTVFQLLRYLVRIWERHRRDCPNDPRLPPVIAVVFHHGDAPWRGPRSLRDLIDVEGLPPEFAAAVLAGQPAFAFHLDDLAAQTEEEIMGRVTSVLAKLALLCMQFLRGAPADDAEAALRRWAQLVRALATAADAQDAFLQLLHYIATISEIPKSRVRQVITEIHPDADDTLMKTYGIAHREAVQEGLQQGLQQGLTLGESTLLLRLLEARFGPLTDDTVARVRAAPPADLERWALAVLTAPTLDAVFAAS